MARFRNTAGWILLALVLLVGITAVWLATRQVAETGSGSVADQLLLTTLSIAVVVLAVGLAGVLIRNLVRLVMDRKRGILGARLQTKLVFFFLALVLPPSLLLFYGSAAVIKLTVEGMVKTPVENVTRATREIADDWIDSLQAQALFQADRLAGEIRRSGFLEAGRESGLDAVLEYWRDREELQMVVVSKGSQIRTETWSPRLAVDPVEIGTPASVTEGIEEVLETGQPVTRLDRWGGGLMAQALSPVLGAPGAAIDEPVGVVAVGIFLPEDLTGRLSEISAASEEFQRFRVRRREIVALYLSLIALIFLASVFVATWMGFYLSRRITGPVQQLAAASREISAGNLDVRVSATVGDELGTLVDAFNEMAAQLQESEQVITRSTADLRRSNRALDERRRYIETLLANLSTGVLSMDGDGRVTTVNPAFNRILSVGIRTGDAIRKVLDREGLGPLRALLDDARETTGGRRTDLSLSLDGETRTVAVQLSPLGGGGGAPAAGRLMMVEDLTDLLRAQKAAAWREVARRIAHEIKNPLTPIQLAAQRLRKKFDEGSGDLPEVVPEATASIESEVQALKRLVDEFSRFARMPEVRPETVELGPVFDSVIALYRGLPGVEWHVASDEQVGALALDAEQFRRALINMIDNAVAAMEGQGEIWLAAHRVNDKVRIEVADSGPGIPPEDRDKMFVPYFSTKGRGTGLGLAIVHRVVTDHKGTIRIEDNPPGGARFVIELPA